MRELYEAIGQGHVFRFWTHCTDAERCALLDDLDAIDIDELRAGLEMLASPSLGGSVDASAVSVVEPMALARLPRNGAEREGGESALARGAVAAVTVAGGQGTRLGFDGPKGLLPVGPVSGACLFQVFADAIARSAWRYGVLIPWYIMTSDATDDATRAAFREQAYFGLEPGQVRIFKQGRMPVLSPDGRMLMADRHRVAMSPDGHGGLVAGLLRCGGLGQMRAEGVEYLSVFQVDNPLVRCVDPVFIGAHVSAGAEISCKVVKKRDDGEGLGNLCMDSGRVRCIEYSDLPDSLASLRNAGGARLFDAGGISVYVMSVAFAERVANAKLPWHTARKRVPYVDVDTGARVCPASPNGIKLERFLFDVLPLAGPGRALVCETERAEEFSAVKNAEGADSPATCRRDMIARAAAWLERCGVSVPRGRDGQPDAVLEISPRFADSAEDLAGRVQALRVERGARVLLR